MSLLFFISTNAQSHKIPNKPSFIPPIIDSTKTLTDAEYKFLFDKLKTYYDSTSTELFVMIIGSTKGEEIARYDTDLGHKWKIGQKGKDNGIIFLAFTPLTIIFIIGFMWYRKNKHEFVG